MENSGLSGRELATALAALRSWQRTGGFAPEMEVATDGGTLKPLSSKEIDALCEKLNGPDLDLSGPGAPSGASAGKGRAGPPPKVSIVLEGGLVSHVVSDVPVKVGTVDYDSEGADEKEISKVRQQDGRSAEAVCGRPCVEVDPVRAAELDRICSRAEKRRHEPEGPMR